MNRFAHNSGLRIKTKTINKKKEQFNPLLLSLLSASFLDDENKYFKRSMQGFTENQLVFIENFDLFFQASSVDFSFYNIPHWFKNLLIIEYSSFDDSAFLHFDISRLSREESFQLIKNEEPLFDNLYRKYKLLCIAKDPMSAFNTIYYNDFLDILRNTMKKINSYPEVKHFLSRFSNQLEKDIKHYYFNNKGNMPVPFWDRERLE